MAADKYTRISEGIRVRHYPSGKDAYILHFSFRGVPCRETLKNIPVTKANNKYAINLLGEINRKISLDTFRYTDYFPDSPRARQFGHAVSTVTIKELLQAWLQDIKRSHPHSTYRAYKKVSDGTLVPHLGNIKATDLADNPEPIRAMIRSRNVAVKTIRNELTPLRAIMDLAVHDNIIHRNPLDRIKVKLLVTKEQHTSPQADPYSINEIMAIIQAAKKHRPAWAPYFQFIFFSGVRTSEGYAAKWKNLDWKKNTLLIDAATVERKEKATKTKASTRHLQLLPMALDALIKQKRETAAWCEYIFINPDTRSQVMDYEETADVLKYLCKKIGIRYRTQRQTRHSFASNLLSGGENPYRVAEMLGHKNVEMVFRVYGTWIDQGKDLQQSYISEFANIEEIKR